ncbi:hypothetical protein EV191_11364 [Tamaricihabitans halophyticus]|uniref:PPE family protein n=1 Tax=Tamaricihabitans halophyticus TaxID=1262583 RepID=A0A4R2QES3_9PSEU|nr:hypothetical protein [Tamaricihabitans halophyticus]TCP46788.1 hypothetical protein EV191_11364 [Tamaricihabitans halophyticus]
MAEEIRGEATVSASALYQMMHSGPGVESLVAAGDSATRQSEAQARINRLAKEAADLIRAGWQGDAADNAQQAAHPLELGAMESSEALMKAQKAHQTQGESFLASRDRMEPVPDSPPETGVWDSMTPWDTDTEKAVSEYNEKSRRNGEIYQAYDTDSGSNVRSMPQQYPKFPEFNGEIAVRDNKSGPQGQTVAPPPETTSPGTTTTAGFSSSPSGGTPGGSPPVTSGPGALPTGGAPNVTGGSGPSGPPVTSGPGPGAPGSVTGVGPTQGANPAAAGYNPSTSPGGGRVPGMGMAPLMGGAAAGMGGDTARGGRAFGARGGVAGSPGSSAAGRLTGGGGPGTGGTPGAGPKTGAGPGGMAAAESAAKTGAAGSSGRGGMAGGPMAGGQRGRGSEDEEHERKTWLIEPDKEGTFGTDEMTAPPVIGEDPNAPR